MVSNTLHGRVHHLLDVFTFDPKSDCPIAFKKSFTWKVSVKQVVQNQGPFCCRVSVSPMRPSHDVGCCLEHVRGGCGALPPWQVRCVVLSRRETRSSPLTCRPTLQCCRGLCLHPPGNWDETQHEIEICDFFFVHTIPIKWWHFGLVWKRCH